MLDSCGEYRCPTESEIKELAEKIFSEFPDCKLKQLTQKKIEEVFKTCTPEFFWGHWHRVNKEEK